MFALWPLPHTPAHRRRGALTSSAGTLGAQPPACSQMSGQPSPDPPPGAQEPSKALETQPLSTSPGFCLPPLPPPSSSWSCPQLGEKPKYQQVAVHGKALVNLELKRRKPLFLSAAPTPSLRPVDLGSTCKCHALCQNFSLC